MRTSLCIICKFSHSLTAMPISDPGLSDSDPANLLVDDAESDDTENENVGSDDDDLVSQMHALGIEDDLPRPIVMPSERATIHDLRYVRIRQLESGMNRL